MARAQRHYVQRWVHVINIDGKTFRACCFVASICCLLTPVGSSWAENTLNKWSPLHTLQSARQRHNMTALFCPPVPGSHQSASRKSWTPLAYRFYAVIRLEIEDLLLKRGFALVIFALEDGNFQRELLGSQRCPKHSKLRQHSRMTNGSIGRVNRLTNLGSAPWHS